MTIKTTNGLDVDTQSPEYKAFLKGLDDEVPGVAEPASYRTLGDVMELQRRAQERPAEEAAAPTKVTMPA